MTRQQLEHLLRASGAITGADEFVVIGSQAILGAFPGAPPELLGSMEADLFTLRSPEDAELIEGSIGEGSPFHRTFGYYAHGVARETAVLPAGWESRLIGVRSAQTGGAIGLCLEPHDLAVAKLAAGRDKDVEFVRSMLAHGLVTAAVVLERVTQTAFDDAARARVQARLARAQGG